MSARAKLTIPGAAVLAAALLFAPAAQAGWSKPKTVAKAPPQLAALAVSARQGAVVAWIGLRSDAITARRIGPRGLLGPVKAVSGPLMGLGSAPQVAVAPSGAAVLVWSVWQPDDAGLGSSTLYARRMSARGKLGPIQTVAHEPDADVDGGVGQQVAMDAAGNATIVWERVVSVVSTDTHGGSYPVRSSVQERRLDADGSLGPVVGIPTEGGLDSAPTLAVAPSGRDAIAWVRRASNQSSVHAALLDGDGSLRATFEVSTPGPYWSGQPASVAIDRTGRATIAWVVPDIAGHQGVAARQLSTRGQGSIHLLWEGAAGFGPVVAVGGAGTATVAWRAVGSPAEGFANSVLARQVHLGGGLGPLRVLSSGAGEVSQPVLAADRRGTATILWAKGDSVQARRISRRGDLGRARALVRGERLPFVSGVGADARGVVTAVWSAQGAIQASRFVPRRTLR